MSSPFPGMDPYLETNPIFQELHTQMLAEMQALLQPQLRPKYVARLERHLSEGSVWDARRNLPGAEGTGYHDCGPLSRSQTRRLRRHAGTSCRQLRRGTGCG